MMVTLDGSSLTTADAQRVLFDFEKVQASAESMERVKKAERRLNGSFRKRRPFTGLQRGSASSAMC